MTEQELIKQLNKYRGYLEIYYEGSGKVIDLAISALKKQRDMEKDLTDGEYVTDCPVCTCRHKIYWMEKEDEGEGE